MSSWTSLMFCQAANQEWHHRQVEPDLWQQCGNCWSIDQTSKLYMNCCEDERLSLTVTGTLLYSTSLNLQQQANDRQRIRVNTRLWKKKDRRLHLHLPLFSSDTVVPASFQFQLPAAQDDYNECKERQAAEFFLWWSLSLANSSITILMWSEEPLPNVPKTK